MSRYIILTTSSWGNYIKEITALKIDTVFGEVTCQFNGFKFHDMSVFMVAKFV